MNNSDDVLLLASNLTLAYFMANQRSSKTSVGIDDDVVSDVMEVFKAFVRTIETVRTDDRPAAASVGWDPPGNTSKDRVLRAGPDRRFRAY